jgi:AcrR family transcriptional regulator
MSERATPTTEAPPNEGGVATAIREAARDQPAGKPMRADARRNRMRIVDAARRCLAESGPDAQVDDIARCAGVGVGTVYRHFPTKDALLAELALVRFSELAELAEAALEEPDAFEALRHSIWRCAELQASDRALSQMMAEHPDAVPRAVEATGLDETTRRLVERAKEQGTLRADFSADDIPMLMCGVARVVQAWSCGKAAWSSDDDPNGRPPWERYVSILLDGLRAEAASPAPNG